MKSSQQPKAGSGERASLGLSPELKGRLAAIAEKVGWSADQFGRECVEASLELLLHPGKRTRFDKLMRLLEAAEGGATAIFRGTRDK